MFWVTENGKLCLYLYYCPCLTSPYPLSVCCPVGSLKLPGLLAPLWQLGVDCRVWEVMPRKTWCHPPRWSQLLEGMPPRTGRIDLRAYFKCVLLKNNEVLPRKMCKCFFFNIFVIWYFLEHFKEDSKGSQKSMCALSSQLRSLFTEILYLATNLVCVIWSLSMWGKYCSNGFMCNR